MSSEAESAGKAIRYALYLVGCRSYSEGRLREKLRGKGFSKADCELAIAWLTEKHYLNEAEDASRKVAYLAQGRLWGKRRLLLWLRTQKYAPETVEGMDFSQIDFVSLCEQFLRKHGTEDKAKQAALRRGFSYSEISAAAGRIQEEE